MEGDLARGRRRSLALGPGPLLRVLPRPALGNLGYAYFRHILSTDAPFYDLRRVLTHGKIDEIGIIYLFTTHKMFADFK